MRLFRELGVLMGCTSALRAAAVFQDGFEAGALGAEWTTDATNTGRAGIETQYEPAAGQRHLVLDDSVSDAAYSVAEAILHLDLAHKRNVVLSFKAKSLGNEPDEPPVGNAGATRAFDGVSISLDGGATWRVVRSLAMVASAWEALSIPLDSVVGAHGGTYGPDFRIRLSGYDNGPAPVDGIAIDDVLVTADEDQRVVVEVPPVLGEDSGVSTGHVVLAFAPAAPLTLDLSASTPGQLDLPAVVIVPAGETIASFSFEVIDDLLVNLTRSVAIAASAPGVASTSGTISIVDNEAPAATLALPAELAEGGISFNNATVSVDRAPSVPFVVVLSANPAAELTLPSSVTIPAGQTQKVFTIRAFDDTRIDGNVLVTVTASNPSIGVVTAQTTAVDNETRTMALGLPATLREGATGAGSLTLSGTLPEDLIVTLTSTDDSMLGVPTRVTLLAGRSQVAFAVTAQDNSLRDGTRTVGVGAVAPPFPDASKVITIQDNDPAGYRFDDLPDIVNVSSPVTIRIVPIDVEGNEMTGAAGVVTLSVVLPDGSLQPLTPPTVNLANGSWTGPVTLPAVHTAPLGLRATDAQAARGDTNRFDIMRVFGLGTADLAWDARRNRIYASVPAAAGGIYADRVVAIDPLSLQITGSVPTGHDPGRLELTSGGEFLYAALNANGTIAKIDPDTLAVSSAFTVGTYENTPMSVGDISTVGGHPHLLVVSRQVGATSTWHHSVAVYDGGVMLPTTTLADQRCNRIEPSADPMIFFAYDTESGSQGFRSLQLNASGLAASEASRFLFSNRIGEDFRSAGNLAVSESGILVDGSAMRRLGSFGFELGRYGLVRPDPAAQRVYFLMQDGPSAAYRGIEVYDLASRSFIRFLPLPAVPAPASGFIRWGPNGLAFRTTDSIVLLTSPQLVPSGRPADLATSVEAGPDPAPASEPLVYTVKVTNRGPDFASKVVLNVTLEGNQPIQGFAPSRGDASLLDTTITATIGDMGADEVETLTITTRPEPAYVHSLTAKAMAESIDPDFTNNVATKLVGIRFQESPDSVHPLFLAPKSLIYDARRGLLWAAIGELFGAPLSRWVVSINPATGWVSDPLIIDGLPVPNSIALSGNGRYLYVGLEDAPEVHRIDLEATPLTGARIPLGKCSSGSPCHAGDIEVLDGDGTSFIIASIEDRAAAVYDGPLRRGATTLDTAVVDRIERTGTPGIFVGLNSRSSSRELSRLAVTPAGVSTVLQGQDPVGGGAPDIHGAGGLVLSTSGVLLDNGTLEAVADLGIEGRPCLDVPNQRAYLVRGPRLHGFDTTTGSTIGALPLPTTNPTDWARTCVRWGLDGFAIMGRIGGEPIVFIARWSQAIPAGADTNANRVPDSWEAIHLGGLGGDLRADLDGDGIPNGLEYVHGTLPARASADPRQIGLGGNGLLRLVFPRRAGLPSGFYGIESTTDLNDWAPAAGVIEAVLATETIGGVSIETVESLVPMPDPNQGFVRLVGPPP